MNSLFEKPVFWKFVFFSLPIFYCLYYAPFGINETDGGFLTGLAWQLQSGKTLYADVIYVRPPVPVWLRLLEMNLLPENWAVLGERCVFYGKVALYAALGAGVLVRENGTQRWILAAFGFILSAHCYPAASWHTVDGILLSVLSIWCWLNYTGRAGALLSGFFIIGAILCKQSFYPMLAVWLTILFFFYKKRPGDVWLALCSMALTLALFILYLIDQNLLLRFWQLTTGATSRNQALEHGLFDYFRINPVVLLSSALVLFFLIAKRKTKYWEQIQFWTWLAWLALLVATYVWTVWQRQEFTVPFAQTRALLLIAVTIGFYQWHAKNWNTEHCLRFAGLTAVTWCAAISWGYNLPALFAIPWVYVVFEISAILFRSAYPERRPGWLPVLALATLLAIFRFGYEFVYRDGRRAEMTIPLGTIFPRLSGIYSNAETAGHYAELARLFQRYGSKSAVLPAFPLANYLAGSKPPLPLDWIVQREMGNGKIRVESAMKQTGLVFFIEKEMLDRIETDPELELTKEVLKKGRLVEKTAWFWVVVL